MMGLRACLPTVLLTALFTPLLGQRVAEACDPGVCFRDAVGDDVTQRPLEAPVFMRYDATLGSAPTTAEFVASGGSDVAAVVEIFPSGEATEVRHHVVMVLPSTPLTAGTTYNMRLTADEVACSEFGEFSFTAEALSLPAAPALTLAAADVTSVALQPDASTDCSDGDAFATSFAVTPASAGDGAALYALRVRDTYPGDAARSVYPELSIVDVRAELPLRYDAVTDETVTTPRTICFVAAAISGDVQFGADSDEVCVTLEPGGEPSTPCAQGSGNCDATGCGNCASGEPHDASAPAWLIGGALVLGWLRRRG